MISCIFSTIVCMGHVRPEPSPQVPWTFLASHLAKTKQIQRIFNRLNIYSPELQKLLNRWRNHEHHDKIWQELRRTWPKAKQMLWVSTPWIWRQNRNKCDWPNCPNPRATIWKAPKRSDKLFGLLHPQFKPQSQNELGKNAKKRETSWKLQMSSWNRKRSEKNEWKVSDCSRTFFNGMWIHQRISDILSLPSGHWREMDRSIAWASPLGAWNTRESTWRTGETEWKYSGQSSHRPTKQGIQGRCTVFSYSSSLLEAVDKGPRQTIDSQCNCNSLAQTNVWILSIHPCVTFISLEQA